MDLLTIYLIGSVVSALVMIKRRLYLTGMITVDDVLATIVAAAFSWIFAIAIAGYYGYERLSGFVIYNRKKGGE